MEKAGDKRALLIDHKFLIVCGGVKEEKHNKATSSQTVTNTCAFPCLVSLRQTTKPFNAVENENTNCHAGIVARMHEMISMCM